MRSIALGLWEFVVGDDWRVAIGIAVMLGATGLVTAVDLPAWWLSPLGTLLILQRAVRRAQRRAGAA